MKLCLKADCVSHQKQKQGYLSVALRLSSESLWASRTYIPAIPSLESVHLHAKCIWVCVYSAGIHVTLFFSSFWVLGTWNSLLMRIIYADLGGELRIRWCLTCSQICLIRSRNSAHPLVTGKWGRVGFSSNSEKRGQIFRKMVQLMLSVSFFNTFAL